MIRIGDQTVYLDVLLRTGDQTGLVSVYDSSQQRIRAFTARANLGRELFLVEGEALENTGNYSVYFSNIAKEKEHFYHAVLIKKELKDHYLMTNEAQEGDDFYHFLMKKYDLPLLKWWGKELLHDAIENGIIKESVHKPCYGRHSYGRSFVLNQGMSFESLQIYSLGEYTDTYLRESVKRLFDDRKIWISKESQKPLEVDDMDSYFNRYGQALVAVLEEKAKPLSQLNGSCNSLALQNKRLFPQQAAMVNGVLRLLRDSRYAILNEGMGVGKTIQATAICEGYFVEKQMRMHPKETLETIYSNRDSLAYRNIVMAPGHTVEKWAKEIQEEIPYAKVTILTEFEQLLSIWNRGKERTCREYWIVSKDFAKLGYMSRPTPTTMKYLKPIRYKICDSCGEIFTQKGRICPGCGNRGYHFGSGQDTVIGQATGMVCPECGEILLDYKSITSGSSFHALQPEDFSVPTQNNSQCYYCDALLWQPHVANIDTVNLWTTHKHIPWYRVTHYANKAHKATKTVWVHKKYAENYFESVGEYPINEHKDYQGVRKYSPAAFIKKYMRGYWDFAVFDEAHLYKGGGTGQGYAMDALIKSSKRQLALTGTIAGGMAQHLFYLLYRLDPRRMKSKGYGWNDVMKFNKKYGTLETQYEVKEYSDDGNVSRKQITRGKQLSEPRVKPGISPLIFTDFLLDRAVFLDLTDMSKYLPPLIEQVVPVKLSEKEREMTVSYHRVLTTFRELLREKGGRKLLGSMLQFSMSYLDKPFGKERVIHPLDGSLVCNLDQYPDLYEEGLLSKEEKLIEILRKELDEGRNCFVYAEFTGSEETCVTYRLKSIIEQELGVNTAILEASSPEPLKREAWIHEQAQKKDIRVFICNPRCVETGLDFCWEHNGRWYNYPTIIFYQMGSSLYTIWQASRRHYRLIQKEECRTYYMGVENTIQMMIQLVAEKQVATSAIQGKFSSEGLAAMAQGVDVKLKMAQALAEQDYGGSNDLQSMFDVLHQPETEDTTYDDYEPMKILSEIIEEKKLCELLETVDSMIDVEEILDMIFAEPNELESNIVDATNSTKRASQTTWYEPENLFSLFNFT